MVPDHGSRMRWPALLLCFALAQASEAQLDPPLLRLDLAPSDVTEATLTLRAPPGTTVTSCMVDCACLRLITTLPVRMPASGTVELRFRVTGLRPGMEEIQVTTTTGTARSQLQLVGLGAGRGLDQLRAAAHEAAASHWRLLGIAHDLRGQVRHCGCSAGALGGAGRLAKLPGLTSELAPGVASTWVLSGDPDAKRPGVGTALSRSGWCIGDPSVRVVDDPLPVLGTPGIVAVIPTRQAPVQHRRIVRPVLTDGLAVELLLVDAAGAIQARRTMPVDDSLPDDPALAAQFRDVLSSRIDPAASPSQNCISCHATAGAAWAQTRHAQALDSLKREDHTDGCINCHVTPVGAAVVAPGVSCQSCHQGGDAHATSQGKLRTTGTTDCRSCHDARHHPTFRRELAWPKIAHGRESVEAP
jgi:hypothetical protein